MQHDSRGITIRVFTISAIILALGVVLRRAWVSDDAFITLRTVENFVDGLGLVYNIGERVQTYTHPLWLFLLSAIYPLKLEPLYIPILLSFIFTLGAFLILLRYVSTSTLSFFFGLLILIFSNSFVDYSTSGLENPLTHFLMAVFF
jgi:arabinofuranosyltransferase